MVKSVTHLSGSTTSTSCPHTALPLNSHPVVICRGLVQGHYRYWNPQPLKSPCFLVLLGIEPGAFSVLGKCSTTKLLGFMLLRVALESWSSCLHL